ncbi:50S ribosomal protein L11 methyltransferase [Lysobacter pythonis]|uniref:Ribosomal protein L11 methyltransferase n=1 Tax=Solilutibacter pythonis TaxID=2483112 RepID=A0A3M2HSY8_9GAMM|nr:50S ribosomal protein L11 methyltransferase [Lysobacter pythonis]RMH92876.1 50S ribosomal protein L11 methyltransferase [Lysobacter pythonis]
MSWLQLTLPASRAAHPDYEAALEAAGALSVTLQDADAETPDERAIFEPGVGETPLWRQMTLTALFEGDVDGEALVASLGEAHPGLDFSAATMEIVEDRDWARAWLDRFQPMRFGKRAWIVPWDHPLPDEARAEDAAIVRLDPGLAFGSGTHPTTALCLEWLDALAAEGRLRDADVLDFGCGSGILALAALKLGAAGAVGIDNDPQAILASRDNAERNGLAGQIEVYLPGEAPARRYPVVVANILAAALDELAETLAPQVAPGGVLAMSGILAGQEDELLLRYAPWFEGLAVERMDDWVRISGRRHV